MLMQSKTRWSIPPSACMSTSTILRLLANAILSAEPNADAIADRLRYVLGRNARWIRPLALRYTQRFPVHALPRRRDVIEFLRSDLGLTEAIRQPNRPLRIAHWVTGSPPMRPVPAAALWNVPPITTIGALAEWLKVTTTELEWFAGLKDLGGKQSQEKLEHYHYRAAIKNTGGIRLVESPKPRLKDLQRRILRGMLNHIPSHSAVHGFVKGRSIQSFAADHVGKRVVLRMDLQDFFVTFSGARIQSFFRTAGYPEPVADRLGGLATNAAPRSMWRSLIATIPHQDEMWHIKEMYARPHLPQGAPTSPALANLCSYRMDCRLHGLAQHAGAAYTRYADDLAFSGGEIFAHGITRFSTLVAQIVKEEGFAVNHHKTRMMRASVRQHLAGMVTNQRLNVPRAEFDLLKATLTNCVRHSPATQNREGHPHFREHLAGRVSFLESIHLQKGKHLRALFDQIQWE
jgi:RNA-directed DNA polymerase